MIKIKSNSWHYRFYKSTSQFDPVNLCEYVQTIIMSVFYWILCWPIKIMDYFNNSMGIKFRTIDWEQKVGFMITMSMLATIGLVILHQLFGITLLYSLLFSQIVGVASVVLLFTILFGIAHLINYIDNLVITTKSKSKGPNLLIRYIKAKKDKFCPLVKVEYKDEI